MSGLRRVVGPSLRPFVRAAAIAVGLAGCATTQSGVLAVKRIDRNQFEVTSHVIGSPSGVDAVMARDDRTATEFCAQKGQPMAVVDRRSYGGVASQDILTFRCGSATAARTKTPTVQGSAPPPAGQAAAMQ